MVFGGTVGTGILRLPGTLAAALGDSRLIVLFWIVGGLYALLGAMAVAELSAMLPEAGGFYVYARRAFGKGAGFVVGWVDWLNQTAAIAYAALTAAVFLGLLWPSSRMRRGPSPSASLQCSPSCIGPGCVSAAHSRASSVWPWASC